MKKTELDSTQEVFFNEFERFSKNVFKKCPMSHLEFTSMIFQLVCVAAYREGESVEKLKSIMDEVYNIIGKGFIRN